MRYKILEADKPNKNGRVYPREVLQAALANIDQNRPLLGQIDADPTGKLDLDKVSHLVTNLRLEGNDLTAEIQILETPKGKELQKMLKEAVFRPSGEGQVHDNPDGTHVVYDYNITAVNAILKKDAT